MIYSPSSSNLRSKEFALALNAQPTADGQAFVNAIVNGQPGVAPATGAAGEKFAGFVTAQTSAAPFQQTTAPAVEELVIPASKSLTLARTPLAGSVLVRNKETGAIITPDSVTGKVVDLTSNGVAGVTVLVQYRYTLTVVEARSRNGDVTPGGYAGLTTGTVSLFQSGTIYTDQFDTAADFGAAGAEVVLGAGALLTTATINANGTKLRAMVVSLPTVDYPYLGIDFDAY